MEKSSRPKITREYAEREARFVWGHYGVAATREDVILGTDYTEEEASMIMDALEKWREKRLRDKTPRHFRVIFDVYDVHDGEEYLHLHNVGKFVLATGFDEAFRIASEDYEKVFARAEFVNAKELNYTADDGYISPTGNYVSLHGWTEEEKKSFRSECCKD